MESIRELFRIGCGPSSSHTMGPAIAAAAFLKQNLTADHFRVTLFGSLAATGKGHLTGEAILSVLPPEKTELIWKSDTFLPQHPNAMLFEAFSTDQQIGRKLVFSIGGGAIRDLETINSITRIYPHKLFSEIEAYCTQNGLTLSDYIMHFEDQKIINFLKTIWKTMRQAIQRGIKAEGILPGPLKLERRASSFYIKSKMTGGIIQKISRSFAYALAVAEENAAGGIIVTAPTCGSCGVVPAVLQSLAESFHFEQEKMLRALAVAALFGNLIKHNASISGAEVGCQGEIGAACSMAAAGAAYLLGGSNSQIEYAAEMALEHHLGLTCDPVAGMVQVPCIERNAMAAERALDCAVYALQTDGSHKISFDQVVQIMKKTGQDMKNDYRETSRAGLATVFSEQKKL